MPRRARLYVGRPRSEQPSNSILPSSSLSCPQTQLKSVVLPAPLGPTRPTLSPARTSNVMSWTALTPPKDFETLRRAKSGRSSATDGLLTQATCHQRLALWAGPGVRSREPSLEQRFESLHRAALLVFEDALGVLGVG